MKNLEQISKISIFKGKKIRKTIHQNEWYFVIVDVVGALTDSIDPSGYIKGIRRRDGELSKGWGKIATPLAIETEGGMSTEDKKQSEIFYNQTLAPNEITRLFELKVLTNFTRIIAKTDSNPPLLEILFLRHPARSRRI